MVHAKWIGLKKVAGLVVVGILLTGLVGASAALAAPIWRIDSAAVPSNIPPGGSGELIVTATNLGDTNAEGGVSQIAITDALPAGFTATAIAGRTGAGGGEMVCSLTSVTCTFGETILPYEQLVVALQVSVSAGAASSVVNEASVSGGGAPSASVSEHVTVSSSPVKYGVEKFE
jgi:uncharacterized repeat protein (TIGR01451 family)